MNSLIPIFFSVNDTYSPFVATAIASIKANASRNYNYRIHILAEDISPENATRLQQFSDDSFDVEVCPLRERIGQVPGMEQLRKHCDSMAVYFRLFIPELFPEYDKAICLDADLVVPGDISFLYREPLGHKLVGAVADYSIQKISPFLHYIDSYVGVDHYNYVNSGVLLLNCKGLREERLLSRFLDWLDKYGLETVAPDQDYLNALCWGSIHYLDPEWNAMPSECLSVMDDPQIVHFNLASKPWLNESVPFDDLFWHYAALSGYEAEIRARRNRFLQDSAAVKKYKGALRTLIMRAARLCHSERSFRSIIETRQELRLCC